MLFQLTFILIIGNVIPVFFQVLCFFILVLVNYKKVKLNENDRCWNEVISVIVYLN